LFFIYGRIRLWKPTFRLWWGAELAADAAAA
jgi:hypothetical protein